MPTPQGSNTVVWRRSSACVGESHCFEMAIGDSRILIRNSLTPEKRIALDPSGWKRFVQAIKIGRPTW